MREIILMSLTCLILASCSGSGGSGEQQSQSVNAEDLVKAPDFNEDSAYVYVEKQVAFGPRVPNSEAHKQTATWLQQKLQSFGASVTMQEFEDHAYDGTKLELVNIIASFNPQQKKRILLAAHWDTRPFADRDPQNDRASLDGANDGGSGVGVLLEVARVIGGSVKPDVGVDIIFFDGEDWGTHANENETAPPAGRESWWCLGSQYWSQNKHRPNYSAFYGILLDMVGAPNATFYYDSVSQTNAARVMQKVWDRGVALGHEDYFIPKLGFQGIIDDHVYVNKMGRIPMIDIIDYRRGQFAPTWHTTKDDMSGIDKASLNAVGEVLLSMLYNE